MTETARFEVRAVPGIPEVRQGDDVGALIAAAVTAAGMTIESGDILVVASKIIAKADGLRRKGTRDDAIAAETVRVVAERATFERVTRVVESAAGPVMAAAGVDESNVGPDGGVLLLPRDPDAAAERLRAEVLAALGWGGGERLGVIVSDTAGRPWRGGVTDFALGSAGVHTIDDHRGGRDTDGRELSVTVVAVADQLAATADLVKRKASNTPVAIVRGLPWAATEAEADEADEARGASHLVRTGPGDWFRLGHIEAVREALGVEPGSPDSEQIGIRPLHAEPLAARIERVRRLALHEASECSGTVDEVSIEFEASDAYALGSVVTRAKVAAASEDLVAEVERLSESRARVRFSAR